MTVLPALPDHPTVLHGDCVEQLGLLPDNSVDAVVTDPPYGISFMGKGWDAPGQMLGYMATGDEQRGAFAYGGTHSRGYADNDNQAFQAWCGTWLVECLRVLKPGGHLLAFGGTRTWHRLACAVEDVGFEIRDSIAWMYGSGFPKSLNVGKAIDKAAGAEREVVGSKRQTGAKFKETQRQIDNGGFNDPNRESYDITAPATDAAKKWEGWGTALKPAFEPIVVARKPIVGTVASNVLAHGTGGLNIDATRIGTASRPVMVRTATTVAASSMAGESTGATSNGDTTNQGRWPANVVLDEAAAAELDRQSGISRSNRIETSPTTGAAEGWGTYGSNRGPRGHSDTGGASRFFYTAKASKQERPNVDGVVAHPTVKPLAIMRWLVRLATQPGGLVLDPFAGSGTTVEACMIEGFRCLAIEKEAEYLPLIEARIARNDLSLFGGVSE